MQKSAAFQNNSQSAEMHPLTERKTSRRRLLGLGLNAATIALVARHAIAVEPANAAKTAKSLSPLPAGGVGGGRFGGLSAL